MTVTPPVATVNGCPIYPDDEKLGGLLAYRGDTFLGVAFTKFDDQPDGPWFAKPRGRDARLFDTRIAALRWLTRETKP